MHDRSLHDEPDEPHRQPRDELPLADIERMWEGLRHQAERPLEFYVFRGLSGYYARGC